MVVVRLRNVASCFSTSRLTRVARRSVVAVGLFATALGTQGCSPDGGAPSSRKGNEGGSDGQSGAPGMAGTAGVDSASAGDSVGSERGGAGHSGHAGAAGAGRGGAGAAGSGDGAKAGAAGTSSKAGAAGSAGGRSAGAAGSTEAKGGGAGSAGTRSSQEEGGASPSPDGGSADASSSSVVNYALPPPHQGMNQFFIPGCQAGVASSPGGGNCTQGQNACEGTKQGAQVNFICPRFMLFSDEMTQAARDDDLSGFNYAVVGHDLDTGGIDGNSSNSCCQCYQLVFRLPENVARVGSNGASAIPMPPPLVVQSFNTAAGGGKNFDVFMGAGGFGAFNACDPNSSKKSDSGKYLYSQFPSEGEPGSGGVNAATQITGCQSNNLATTESLSSETCRDNVTKACSKFASSSSQMTDQSIRSCKQSNDPNSYYHMNWEVYAKRVRCPTHLMEVTGCKLQPEQGLAAVSSAVKTPEQAAADSSFKSGYTVTTMQDCCMPTCAWQNNVSGQNIPVTDKYNSFYSCNQDGVPMTESTPSP